MNHQHSKLTVDFAGLGIPPGSYALPAPGAYDGYDRLERHFTGDLALTDLPPDDVQFLRNHFCEQVTEHRQQAMDYFSDRVPRRFAEARPDERATAWAEQFAGDRFTTKSLLLLGATGTGKTHLAYSVLRAVAETGVQTRWQTFTAADLYAHLRPRDGQDSQDAFTRVADAALLFLDDLGAAKFTEWTEEITYRLINHRYERCLPGIFTSNVPPAQLRDVLGERVTSRLSEMCDRIAIKGDDRRKGGAK
ncbi:ATP-binding protein [Streptomyces mirabilis]|uniref:ATP-binding protein n=1 Tax=Streptomyces mirabilis TaxID=68239 RepID=UPI003630152C